MANLTHEESVSKAFKVITILAIITAAEVAFALLGKGYLIDGVEFPNWIVGGVMIIMSIVKAYLIIYEFMHMKYEIPGLVKSVMLPVFLLVWAVIAFFSEGNYWKNNRMKSKESAKVKKELQENRLQGSLIETKELNSL